jgi:hypothetical protein
MRTKGLPTEEMVSMGFDGLLQTRLLFLSEKLHIYLFLLLKGMRESILHYCYKKLTQRKRVSFYNNSVVQRFWTRDQVRNIYVQKAYPQKRWF